MCSKKVLNFLGNQGLIVRSGRLACSYFDSAHGTLYTMEDTDENRHYDLTTRSMFN